MTEINREMHVWELELGDIVRTFEGPFSTAIVHQIDEVFVKLFRPYGRAEDFTHSDGVICYTGIEHYALFKSDKHKVFVYSRFVKK